MSVRIVPTITEPARAKHQGTRRSPWSPRELQVLRERYRDEGAVGCAALLPDRGMAAINQRAARMSLRHYSRYSKPRERTPALDAAIRRLYASPDMNAGALRDFCRQHKCTRQWVHIVACELGAAPARRKEPDWTEAEDALVEEHAHRSLDFIQRRLIGAGHPRRSEAAIGIRRKRITDGVHQARIDAGIYSANDIASVMGIDVHTPLRWISHHGLRATTIPRRIDGRAGRYEVTRRDLRDWLLGNLDRWDHRKCDMLWLVDLLSDGSRLIGASRREAA